MFLSSPDYWRLPLQECYLSPPESPRTFSNYVANTPYDGNDRLSSRDLWQEITLPIPGPDFWKLPLPLLDDSLADETDKAEGYVATVSASIHLDALDQACILQKEVSCKVEAKLSHEIVDGLALGTLTSQHQKNARATIEQCSLLSPMSAGSDVICQLEDTLDLEVCCHFLLPYEVVGRAFYYLDCRSLLRSGRACSEWGRLSRSKGRWRSLFKADWGMRGSGSRREYRQWLERWCLMKSSLSNLKGRGHPGNNFGSAPRRQLYKVLESIVDLCAAERTAATYPSRLAEILRESSGLELMLALLDDESSHLVNLALKCLGDIAADPFSKIDLREALHKRSCLIREFLEGADMDLAESASRALLNLIDDAYCTPLCFRRRGPFELMPEGKTLTPLGLAASWVGVWSGEMRYARSGACDSIIHLALGFENDPVTAQVAARIQAIGVQDSVDTSSRCPTRSLLTDAGEMQKWCHELEHVACLSDLGEWSSSSAPSITGAGLDEKAGAFTAEVQLPSAVAAANFAATGMPWAQAPAAPARMLLQYEQRLVKIELVCFLCEGSDHNGEKLSAMYGIWGTVPPRQRHLFVLRRLATLPTPPSY